MQNFFETAGLPLLAADFDYFRLPPETWALLLTRLKQMGANAVVINIPWGFHEVSQGNVDLTGVTNARRDVAGVVNLCQELDLYCLLNPGPYNHNGVLGHGLPLWLPTEAGDVEPALTTAAEGWYKAVSKALVGRQWPHGPIVALHITPEPPEPGPQPYSKQLTEVKWRIWLRKRYKGIEALNTAYGTRYRTVNDVKFPHPLSAENTPLQQDAREFLTKVQADMLTHYTQILVDAGWQIPVYPPASDLYPSLPPIHTFTLPGPDIPDTAPPNAIFILRQPIRVDPDPPDIGRQPVWAANAPIHTGGALQPAFWKARRYFWTRRLPQITLQNQALTASFNGTILLTAGQDLPLKLNLPAGTKASVYRLRLTGELVASSRLAVKRSKLSGVYLAADDDAQTDLVLAVPNPASPLPDFPRHYLSGLLVAQAAILAYCAGLAQKLAQTLVLPPAPPAPPPAEHPGHTLSTLEQARRGLQEADAALRKAMTAIGGLENGFATILDKTDRPAIPQPVTAGITVTPEIIDGPARDLLLETGQSCANIVPALASAAENIRQALAPPAALTIDSYRQQYQAAVDAAQTARRPLLESITRLRTALAAETLPLVTWQIHNQVQLISETLRYGVLRS